MPYNPRRTNGNRRNKLVARVKARQDPCGICGKPIDYSLPHEDPMSFELDEIIPVSKYWLGGYQTPQQCALDPNNVQASHKICNRRKGNKIVIQGVDLGSEDKPTIHLREWEHADGD